MSNKSRAKGPTRDDLRRQRDQARAELKQSNLVVMALLHQFGAAQPDGSVTASVHHGEHDGRTWTVTAEPKGPKETLLRLTPDAR